MHIFALQEIPPRKGLHLQKHKATSRFGVSLKSYSFPLSELQTYQQGHIRE